MQISTLVNQYNSMGGGQAAEGLKGTKGVQKLVSTSRDLAVGNVFEGTVNSNKNGKVVLGLSNGQTITARLDGKVDLREGDSMFFQVKSNDGGSVEIRPYTVGGNSANLTLVNALQAAGLPLEERNLSMVNALMQRQMPIDRNSLHAMERVISAHPNVNVETIVDMHKLGIPITDEMAAQFENYMDDSQAISVEMESFMEELPNALSDESLGLTDLRVMNQQVLDILTEGLANENSGYVTLAEVSAEQQSPEVLDANAQVAEQIKQEMGDALLAAGAKEAAAAVELLGEYAESIVSQVDAQIASQEAQQLSQVQGGITEAGASASDTAWTPQVVVDEHSLLSLLSSDGQEQLSEALKQFPGMEQNTELFSGGRLNLGSSSLDVLHAVREALGNPELTDKSAITDLFSSDSMKVLLKDVMGQQWTMKPDQLESTDKIKELYDKLENQISRMENALKATGMEQPALAQTAADIRGNVDFMNQINQAYTYVQIPLKMNGQNASGELYVYTNKKKLAQDGEKELTAFLHLDLDHLGSTDVSIKMLGKKVDTNFFFEDDASFALVEKHLPELEERLNKKGYTCKLTVTNENKHVNFVEDFLMKDHP